MQCTRMSSFRKAMLTMVLKPECQCASTNSTDILGRWLFRQPFGDVASKNVPKFSVSEEAKKLNVFQKMFSKIDVFDTNKYRMMVLGYLVYENIADTINYSTFFKDFNMPDTFFSWFLITELHVWMAMARYMAEGKDGRIVRTHVAEAMWMDIQTRTGHLGPISAKVKRNSIQELSHQFNAAIIGYDEGILSDDKVLASALWRRFFRLECNNPEQLERLLIFVRKQVNILDKIPSKEVLSNPKIKWLDLSTIRDHPSLCYLLHGTGASSYT